jgi:hypothetical protein
MDEGGCYKADDEFARLVCGKEPFFIETGCK